MLDKGIKGGSVNLGLGIDLPHSPDCIIHYHYFAWSMTGGTSISYTHRQICS